MSGDSNPIDNPQAWDFAIIGGKATPGCIKSIDGFERPYGWDKKKGKGAKGATGTLTNMPPAEGSITWELWTSEHFRLWDEIRAIIKYDPTKKPASAFDIYHPSLADVDVNSVVTEGISPIKHDGGGRYSITVKFGEYLPSPKASATSTPGGSRSSAGATPGATPDPVADEQQRQIAALLAKAQEP